MYPIMLNTVALTSTNVLQVLDDILEGRAVPSELSRLSVRVNMELLPTYALNDILVARPCPAEVSLFSFRSSIHQFLSPQKVPIISVMILVGFIKLFFLLAELRKKASLVLRW